MAWPTDNITTLNLDASTDDPSQARAEIKNAMDKTKDVIAGRNTANGVAPLDASGLVPLANIPATLTGKDADTVDGAHAGTAANNVLKLDASALVPLANIPLNWTMPQLVGSGLTITGTGLPALATLNATDVAFIDSVNESLRTYRWNGSTWALVGSGLTITGTGLPALAALNATDVAFIDDVNETLSTYRWNGSTWALVGSGLAIANVYSPALAALNATDVAFIDSGNYTLRTYRFGFGIGAGPYRPA